MRDTTRVLIALVAAVLLGIVIGGAGNAALLSAVDWLVPVGTLWVTAIRMTVIPLVVSLVITGVASVADVRSVGKIGARSMAVFLGLLLFVAAIAVPAAPLLFGLLPPVGASRPPLPAGAAEVASEIAKSGPAQSASAWIVSLLPTNPIAAAATGAMLPLVLFAILFALALTQVSGRPRETLVDVFRAIGDTMQVMVAAVIRLAPIGIFALVLPLAAHTGSAFAGAIGFYVLVYSGVSVAMALLLYPVVALAGGIPMATFAKAALPAQLIAFSSSSSVASLPALIESADERLRLPSRASGFVLPLAVSTLKAAAPLSWAIGACFIGWFYGVPLGVRELGTVAFAGVFLSFATPGVPNGAFLLLTPLFVQIGLPPEGIGILIALDAIPDRFSTVMNVTGDLAAAAIVTGRGEREREH
jgi:proton glutamate symport protein